MVIRVTYSGETKRFPYPTDTIDLFISRIRVQFGIDPDMKVTLYDGNDGLTTEYSLNDLGVKDDTELHLKVHENDFKVTVQDVNGDINQYDMNSSDTLKALHEKAKTKMNDQRFPLLFNHRMHLFKTDKFFNEPLANLMPLSQFNDACIPQFYVFECERKYESNIYDYVDVNFNNDESWKPTSIKQSDEAMLVFLNSMYALRKIFSTGKDAEFDTIHMLYLPQFLIVLRRYLFPPACLAFKHLIEGRIFQFEKLLLSEALCKLLDLLLAETIPRTELFSYIPYLFCWIFKKKDQTSADDAGYEEAVDFLAEDAKYRKNPVRLLTDKLEVDASKRFVLKEYDFVKDKALAENEDYQKQSDLRGFFVHLEEFRKKKGWNIDTYDSEFFKLFSAQYTIWLPDKQEKLLEISNVFKQKEHVKRRTPEKMRDLKEELSNNDLYSIFTFADPTKLSKFSYAQFVMLNDHSIVYIQEYRKNCEDRFCCFDPKGTVNEFQANEALTLDELRKKEFVVIRENSADIRLIEQATVIMFDVSRSMKECVGNRENNTTRLDLSTMAFTTWRDRLRSYRLPHAIGLIYFGTGDIGPIRQLFSRWIKTSSEVTNDNETILVRCEVTRDFNEFEKALGNQPACGSGTPLYDAIDLGIQKIKSFRINHEKKLSQDCKSLILCLTDGEDTCSAIKQPDILQKLMENQIIFDSINFVPKPNSSLVELCEKTKGYYYTNIPHDTSSLLNLFELEAAISVKDREETTYGSIKSPQRRKPAALTEPAIAAKTAPIGVASTTNIRLKRIMLEIKSINRSECLDMFEFFISKENVGFWKVIMKGPVGTPYVDGFWLISIEFPVRYPQQPPEIRFITPIYHCNVNDDGKICHDILTSAWSEKTNMSSVLLEIVKLLGEPNADDALSAVKGALLKASQDEYNKTVKEWKALHASLTVNQLKEKYNLE